MTEKSKHKQHRLDSDANASQPEKPTFSPECGPLTESEIASLKALAQQTAREALGSEAEQPTGRKHQL